MTALQEIDAQIAGVRTRQAALKAESARLTADEFACQGQLIAEHESALDKEIAALLERRWQVIAGPAETQAEPHSDAARSAVRSAAATLDNGPRERAPKLRKKGFSGKAKAKAVRDDESTGILSDEDLWQRANDIAKDVRALFPDAEVSETVNYTQGIHDRNAALILQAFGAALGAYRASLIADQPILRRLKALEAKVAKARR